MTWQLIGEFGAHASESVINDLTTSSVSAATSSAGRMSDHLVSDMGGAHPPPAILTG